MRKLIGYTERFVATVGRRACKRYSHEPTVVLGSIKYKNVIIAHHSWVECGDEFRGIKEGERIEFQATVVVYNKHSSTKKYGFTKPTRIRRLDVRSNVGHSAITVN